MVKGKIDFTKLTTNKGKFKQTYSTAAKRNAWAAKMGKKKGLTPAQIQSQLSSFNSSTTKEKKKLKKKRKAHHARKSSTMMYYAGGGGPGEQRDYRSMTDHRGFNDMR
tara:strand:- start:7905 stop:8228 length:324 start_codon:yes stop_codon:yes gene_type:complete